MDGVLNIRKPGGPTSHDVVDEVRRIFEQKKVGHAGTLDPMATGVLVVCLGRATRIVEYLMGAPKEYRARMALGISTDTQDATGAVTGERDASPVTREAFEEAAAAFVGEIEQVPPMISALKHGGRPLYKLARDGITVERAPRTVTIHSIEVIGFQPGVGGQEPGAEGASPSLLLEAEIRVRCSSGTYIRTLCADIGEKLGCGAHMTALERTSVGRFRIEDSVTLEELCRASSEGRMGKGNDSQVQPLRARQVPGPKPPRRGLAVGALLLPLGVIVGAVGGPQALRAHAGLSAPWCYLLGIPAGAVAGALAALVVLVLLNAALRLAGKR